MNDLAVELWSTLPPELVERALSFLPAPVLCRLRTVCKRWNSIICKPEFGALCIQRAREDACFIVLCEEKGWSFLDLSARRWYTIQHDEQRWNIGRFRDGTLASMDGGLVCLPLITDCRNVYVYVSSPTAKKPRRLPYCSAMAASIRPVLDMVVDNVALTYKVFLIPYGAEEQRMSADKPFMVIYESTTNQWRNSTILHTPLIGFPSRATCCVFFEGLLYVLMSPSTTVIAQHDCLWSYNHVEDVWKNTCVIITHIRSFHYPQLIVSDNRLFLASWMQKQLSHTQNLSSVSYETWPWAQDGWSYEISAVHLGDRTCSTIFDWTEAAMRQVLAAPILQQRFSVVHVKAFGCCKSIVLLCMSSGMSIVYDLRTCLWETLPCKPPQEGPLSFLYGKPMNLILPITTLWDQLHETDQIIDQGRKRNDPFQVNYAFWIDAVLCKLAAELYQHCLPSW